MMQKIKLSEIQENPNLSLQRNTTKGGNIIKSLAKYGQLRPIILNKKKEIIDGRRLYNALKVQRATEAWCIIVEDANAHQLYLEVNLTGAEPEDLVTEKAFEYMTKIDLKDHCLPFSEAEIAGFIHLIKFDWKNLEKDSVKISSAKQGGRDLFKMRKK